MGGQCCFAVRFPDGRAYATSLHTSQLMAVAKSPRLIDPADNEFWREIIPCRPDQYRDLTHGFAEYGVVVVDHVSHVIIDANHYTDVGTISVHDWMFSPTEFDLLAKSGRLRTLDAHDNVGPPLSPNTALRLAEQRRLRMVHGMYEFNHLGERTIPKFTIDLMPFRIVKVDTMSSRGEMGETARRWLRRIGFPLSAAEGLNPREADPASVHA